MNSVGSAERLLPPAPGHGGSASAARNPRGSPRPPASRPPARPGRGRAASWAYQAQFTKQEFKWQIIRKELRGRRATQRAPPRRGGGQGGGGPRAPRHHVRRPGRGRAAPSPPRPTAPPHPSRPMCASRRSRAFPRGDPGLQSDVVVAAAAAAAQRGRGLQFPFRSVLHGATWNARGSQCGSPARRTRQWLGAHLPGAHLPGSSPGTPPQRRLSRARPASSSTCLPRTAGAEVTYRFGRSAEGRGCSKRCRPGCRLYTAGCIRPACVSGLSSTARSDYAVRLPFFSQTNSSQQNRTFRLSLQGPSDLSALSHQTLGKWVPDL